MKLWKDTFHDSDAYVNLIFKNYFDLKHIKVYYKNGSLISAMLGIPFDFTNPISKSISHTPLKGLYLCGLATMPSERGVGMMTSLLEEMNDEAEENNFDFTFLIPANKGLVKFYEDRNYRMALRRTRNRYLTIHDFEKQCVNDALKCLPKEGESKYGCGDTNNTVSEIKNKIIKKARENFKSYKVSKIDKIHDTDLNKIATFINEYETTREYTRLIHSSEDVENIIKEYLLSDGNIYIVKSANNENIEGICFIAYGAQEGVEVRSMMCSNQICRYRLLAEVANDLRDNHTSFTFFDAPFTNHREALWKPVFGAVMPEVNIVPAFAESLSTYSVAQHAEEYGMIRLLNPVNVINFMGECQCKNENSTLEAVNNCSGDVIIHTSVGDYQLISKNYVRKSTKSSELLEKSKTVITVEELSEILFRPISDSSIISEALGIPRLPIYMDLLFD